MPTIADVIILTVTDLAGIKTLKFSITLTQVEDLPERFPSKPLLFLIRSLPLSLTHVVLCRFAVLATLNML